MDAETETRRQRRGTKRTCKSCEQRFYDLGRDPTVCPMCQASLPAASFMRPPEPQRGGYSGSWSRNAAVKSRPIEFEPAAVPDVEQEVDEVVAEEVPAAEGDVILEQEDEGESDVSDILAPGEEAGPDE